MNKHRKSAVAGMFYPDNCSEIKHFIDHFTKAMPPLELDVLPRALIVPHAGYIYSGYTANLAYHYTASKHADIERVVVLGPSHRIYIAGASIALFESYHTPCGEIEIDLELSHALEKQFAFLSFNPLAHEEHSTEVQMPLIRHYFKHAKVVEIVYGDVTSGELSRLIDALLNDEKTLLVISTDLSHFYTEEEANALDQACINAISHLDLHALTHGCEACGITGVKAMVQSALTHNFQAHFLDYRTSFARSNDTSRVVGYASFILG
ncbi:AmmeMemoRadiSam system protein B [Sulfurospirillum halorespirans]|uniref:MEMO1 family protein SHALO_0043 n=1 Tax=Sulfurospirillum halorespirans DSM 13726 TaxID=1193502 RepID=A0A1D7TFR7_9BACT|nr:AmmeMemoRadiSam system protein B [Sulfurospirillum halorespirans]AOO63845.1 ammeMemoRadiSam system protein B, Memo family protein [Sulfurospirillum halorespirans DSM 13726]